ncbi:MAG: hypothetical protein DIJKHBIC_02890 [Thermoanaerobaculia bacterium]|nr:hypothetical protein [Thermoanaerobaculia bacterium]
MKKTTKKTGGAPAAQNEPKPAPKPVAGPAPAEQAVTAAKTAAKKTTAEKATAKKAAVVTPAPEPQTPVESRAEAAPEAKTAPKKTVRKSVPQKAVAEPPVTVQAGPTPESALPKKVTGKKTVPVPRKPASTRVAAEKPKPASAVPTQAEPPAAAEAAPEASAAVPVVEAPAAVAEAAPADVAEAAPAAVVEAVTDAVVEAAAAVPEPSQEAFAPGAATGPAEPGEPEATAEAEAAAVEEAGTFDGHAPLDRPNAYATQEPEGEPGVDRRLEILKELPFLTEKYNETYLYLVPCDPKSVFVIWELSEGTLAHLAHRFGQDFLSNNALILRVYDVTGIDFNGFNANSFFEVDDFLIDKNNYWVRAQSGRSYVAELGFRAHGTTFFEMVARSNAVFVPRGETENAEKYADFSSAYVEGNNVEIPVGGDQWRWNQYLYWKRRTHAAPEEKGYWSLVLHQHLPFVRHPEYEVSLEEQWFFEAVTSVYTQLLHLMWKLERDKVDFRLTVSLTPPLLSMMQNPDLKARAWRHIDECIRLATRERDRSWGKPQVESLNETLEKLWIAKRVFEAYEGDLTRGYRDFQNAGKLEVITCAATHFLLPLYMHQPETLRAQIQTACRQYLRVFGRWPRGIWLPENAFTPGLDEALAREGIRWTLLSSKGVLEGDTRSFFGTSRPVISPSGVAFFGIDEETRAKIWSREHGYPGSPNYKEWYRDLGYDLPWDEVPEYFRTAGVRRNSGIKYHRIGNPGTGLGHKPIYMPSWAKETAEIQAGQFVFERGAQATHMLEKFHRKPCIVSAYDAELFGHWWEEGPYFLETVFRKMLYDQDVVRPVTPGEFLSEHPGHQKLVPGASSWGKSDYYQTWVEGRDFQPNTWLYRHIFRLCQRMSDLATQYRDTRDDLKIRALNQAARSLFLAGASDWGFLISTGQAVRYSEVQMVTHLDRAKELLRQVAEDCVNADYLAPLETADCIFPYEDMDFKVFSRG